ncbi:MAG: outer membrane protein assembly factor BamB [Thiomargarita sp.]|nr:outer membrane protein assembly factor BamB [Thiomargarita sp.]
MRKYIVLLYTFMILSGCGDDVIKENRPEPLLELTPHLTLKTLWRIEIEGDTEKAYLKLAPVFHQKHLFTATPEGQVQAFNKDKQVWSNALDLPLSAGPSIGEGLVLVGSLKGHVIALSEADGSEQWRILVTSEVLAKPRISQGVVVVRTIDGKLFGLNSKTGKRLWVYERNNVPLLSLRGTSTPIIKNEEIIAGFDNGKIAGLELKTGKVLWEAALFVSKGRNALERMVDIDADPLLIDDILYVSNYQNGTVAIDLIPKKQVWERKIPSYAGIGADYNFLYITDPKSHIWALDRESGEDLWTQKALQFRTLTAPVNMGDYIVIGDFEGYVHWMRRSDGEIVARYAMEAAITVPPIVVNDMLIVSDSSGYIVALRPEALAAEK